MRQQLWEADCSARTIGDGYRTVEFESATFTQQKNKRNAPVHMEIPIAPELRIVMHATKMGDMAFLING